MNEALEAIKVVDIDHLGIVAGIIDEMELVEEVNKKVRVSASQTLLTRQFWGLPKAQISSKLLHEPRGWD
ncbi:MAG: DUF4277 domain-containing protein [Iphinoe sp. HA4291-MV1]|jgi:hypothetical protein|nr:DUF4277 domain-containing protein [Iphinoe sp. HA4291-MV1]